MTEVDVRGGAPPAPATNDPAPEHAPVIPAVANELPPPSPDEPLPPFDERVVVPAAGRPGIDFSSPFAFAALVVAYVASRAPFINISYGADPDAWRVALAAYWLRRYHEYYPSRVPGYPLPELASALVIRWDWLATNSLTLVVSLLGVWFFARIAREVQLTAAPLVVIGFAFAPLLWINSMNTMDYMWALTFILGCYFFLLRRQVPLAGIMLGLAAASRPTSIALIVPFAVYIVRDGRRSELRDFIVWSIAPAMLAYLPVVWRYGPDFINFYDAKVGFLNVFRLVAKDCLGIIGAVGVLVAAALSLPRLARLPADFVRDKHVTLWLLIIAFTAIVFIRLPHETAFLAPIFPFGFLIMGRYFRPSALVVAVAAIVFAGFIDVRTHSADLNAHALVHARIGQGLVLDDRSTMKAQIAYTHELERQQFPDRSVVMVGFAYPQFAILTRERLTIDILEKDTSAYSQLSDNGKAVNGQHGITYVWVLDRVDFDRFLLSRTNIYYTADAARAAEALFGYRPGTFDGQNGVSVKQIDITGEPPRAVGEANTPR